MKRLLLATASLLFVSYASAVGAASQPTPGVNPSVKASAIHPLLHQVNTEMKEQWKKVMADQKGGKLTVDQAKALRQKLSDIHKQVVTDFKANPNHELTAEQAAQINQQLQTNAQSIP
jgi:hypothetical protein